MRWTSLLYLASLVALIACNKQEEPPRDTVFHKLSPDASGISFNNELVYTEKLNTYTFRNFYNGGGVGLGDFNNDGLLDIFFSGSQVSNRLYLNEGSLKFRDITERAGLASDGLWTTGVSVVDINADGWLDIYLCRSGPPGGERRHNELFINNGDLTFREQSKQYGLAFEGLSTHAAFFDYDLDGDLDCYLLNNSYRPVGGFDLRPGQRNIPDPDGGNKLLRNDNGKYNDVTLNAGIYSSQIGFGLGVTVGDVNLDGYPDLFVSNDFFEKDYLYINQKNGTFRESLEDHIREISMGSMGADMADINNDGLPEIFVTEMLPEHDARLKTTSQFESYDRRMLAVKAGYYHQFSRNVLQLNNGNGTFSEIARFAGVHATDWSWGALIFDMDRDGFKDIFVANGIYKDLLDQDYVNFIATPEFIRESIKRKEETVRRLIDSIPSNKLPNYAFHNQGNLQFVNRAEEWGLGEPSHANGSAYGDLDNDGDLDIVVSNVNMVADVYENRSEKHFADNHFLSIALRGDSLNRFAIGAKATLVIGDTLLYQELFPMRGFMSSVDYKLNFGIGSNKKVDEIVIEWADGKRSSATGVQADQLLTLHHKDAITNEATTTENPKEIFRIKEVPGADFVHTENDFVDFDRDRLLFNMISNEGPCVCVGDVNGDRRDDFYIGGAKGQAGALYIQTSDGKFRNKAEAVFEADKESEDTDCVFFDANGDGRTDLYVTSGSNEASSSSFTLADRLYLNNGNSFRRSEQILPVQDNFVSTSSVRINDIDHDGDMDLFVGGRVAPFQYGVPENGYILENDGKGRFRNVTSRLAVGLEKIGMITDARWVDLNNDGDKDLVVVGEWMPVSVFLFENGKYVKRSKDLGFDKSEGWYNTLAVADVNNDGFADIITGNHGLNSRFKATAQEPLELYVNDFDQNGTVEHIITRYDEGVSYPYVLRHDLLGQIPSLKKKFLYFDQYKGKTINHIFNESQVQSSLHLAAYDLESSVWMNNGGKGFKRSTLPADAQFSPVYAIEPGDFDGDGKLDLLMGGNLYRAKPETGIYDASYGLFLKGKGDGTFAKVPPSIAGLKIKGEIRALNSIKIGAERFILAGRNNDKILFLKH